MNRKPLAFALLALVAISPAFLLAQPAPQPKSTPGSYKLDPVHSYVNFHIQHAGAGTSWGRVTEPTGTLTIGDDGAISAVEVTLDINKLDTANPKRDDDIKGPDYFNARQFPEMTFKSTAVKARDDGGFDVTGDLTIKGTTKPITVGFTKVGESESPQMGHRVGFDTSFTVDRLDYNVGKPPMLGKDVTVMISVEAVKQ